MVGKKIAKLLYIHRLYTVQLDSRCRVLFLEAREYLKGNLRDKWNLVKINREKRTVSFLSYPDFDMVGHPELKLAVTVNLNYSPPSVRILRGGEKILHRKELFVDKDYPNYQIFSALTAEEEKLGLLEKSTIFNGKKLMYIIGQKRTWENWLQHNKVKIQDHKIIKLDNILL